MSTPPSAFFGYGHHDDDEVEPLDRGLQDHLESLFAEFHRPSTPPSPHLTYPIRTQSAQPRLIASAHVPFAQGLPVPEPKIDLRDLDYVSDYDPHLMCPICHVPFVDPIVLDCDHTFCRQCYDEYCREPDPRVQCPTCRAYILGRPQRASRLIVNMCDDVKVRCPNDDCEAVHARGYMERHAIKECREYPMDCPGRNCDKKVKRKNFIDGTCIHSSHIECDCGAVIELGRGEWLKHKDEDCPATGVKCEACGERITVKAYLAGQNGHICQANITSYCPGVEFGCSTNIPFSSPEELEFHSVGCPFARLAPHFKKQAENLKSVTEQLALAKVRNEVLETGLDKINDIINNRVLPVLPTDAESSVDTPARVPSPTLSIEEVPRIPYEDSPVPPNLYTDLALPAHLRPLTPNVVNHHTPHHRSHSQHLEAEAEMQHLAHEISQLRDQLHGLQANHAESSMMHMNETLRLKEEQAQQGAGLFSIRAQVQWLLNRERERIQIAHHQAAAAQQGQSQPSSQGGAGVPAPGPSSSTTSPAVAAARPVGLQRGRTSMASNTDRPSELFRNPTAPVPASGTNGEGSTTSTRSSFSNAGVGLMDDAANAAAGVPISGAVPMARGNSGGVSGGVAVGVGVAGASPRMVGRPGGGGRRLSGSQERVKL
ncbi:uncharacterized protein AB675_1021 [Cyphellophora attinorum]|uniref:RING-type domain-containing protein n=1 Tax=Cyphellophora attinorum TaxID=1664694 RepID=A0A0N1NXR0_9EURO|nr:uncharacterized protein AB675_1021 [Phialophora attinorum]KPI38054.1 hypothetical protein AB675_1021 [Phialophora attinorum]